MKKIEVKYDNFGKIQNVTDEALYFEHENMSLQVDAKIETDKFVRAYIRDANADTDVSTRITPSEGVYSLPVPERFMSKGTLYIGFEIYDNDGYCERLQPVKVYVDDFVSLAKSESRGAYSVTVTVGEVEILPAGFDAYVDNVGTAKDVVLNIGIPQGEKGEKGDKGDTGKDATIEIESVEQLETGEMPTVLNVGTVSEARFKFGIPKGEKGDTGEQGPKGEPGYTPVKGTDYFTQQEVDMFKQEVESDLEVVAQEVDELQISMTQAQNDINNLHTPIDTLAEQMSDVQTDIEDLQRKNTFIEPAIGELAEAVVEEAPNIYCNALKGFVSGNSIITIKDVSPIPHNLYVDTESETIEDMSNVELKMFGKNLFDVFNQSYTTPNDRCTAEVLENGTLRITNEVVNSHTLASCRIPYLLADFVGQSITLSLNTNCSNNDLYAGATINFIGEDGSTSVRMVEKFNYGSSHISITTKPTESHLQKYKYITFSFYTNSTTAGIGAVGDYVDFSNIQLEISDIETGYEEFKELDSIGTSGYYFVNTYPNITLLATTDDETIDTSDVIINVEYNKDINKAFAQLQAMLLEG